MEKKQKISFNTNPNSKITNSPRKIYSVFVVATIAMTAIIIFFMYTGYTIATKFSPLTDAVIKIQLHCNQAHVLLEEYYIGDKYVSIEKITKCLDKAIWYSKAMLNGGNNENTIIKPADEPLLREQIETLEKKLTNIKIITLDRIQQIDNTAVERSIDHELDSLYWQLVRQSEEIEKSLKSKMQSTVVNFRYMQVCFVFVFLFLSFTIFQTIRSYERKRKVDLQKLQERENHLWAINQSVTSIAVIPATLEGTEAKIVDFNPGAERMFGYKRDEVIGKEVSIIHKADDVSKFPEMQDQIKVGKQFYSGEFEMIRKNGDTFPAILTLHPRFDADNNQIGVTGVVTDITEHKEYQKQIHLHTEQLQSMVEERTIELEEKNDKLQEAYNRLKESQTQIIQSEKMAALGMLLASVAHEINNPLGAIINSNTINIISLKKIIEKLPNVSSYFEYNRELAFNFINEAAKTNHYISSSEKRLIKNEMQSNLDGNITGDLHTTIQKLIEIGITDNYKEYIPLLNSEYGLELLELAYTISLICQGQSIIEEGTEKTSTIVSALRDYVHSGNSKEKVESDINHTIQTVLTLFGNIIKHGIDLKLDLQEIPLIKCYPQELNQVWTNLIQNALHAMGEDGVLTISSKIIDGNIIVTIEDNGCGIPEEIKERIFDPLFTTKPPGVGSGIGLDIVKNILLQHNGSISVESCPGKGSTFVVTIPVNQSLNLVRLFPVFYLSLQLAI